MPDTTNYMYLGLAAVGVLMGIYSLGLILRFRAIRQDRKMIEQYTTENDS